jgi:hypothetical protein
MQKKGAALRLVQGAAPEAVRFTAAGSRTVRRNFRVT